MKQFLPFIFLLLSSISLSAQDVIFKQDGSEIKAEVTEIGSTEIKYKKFENLSGPVYTILKNDVFMIKYKNGTKDVFTASTSSSSSSSNGGSSANGNSGTGYGASLEFVNQVYLLRTAANTLHSLEKGNPEVKVSSVAAPFYASSSSSWMLAGGSSNVRINSSGGYAFLIKISPGIDPVELIRLVKFQVWSEDKKNPSSYANRHMMASKVSGSIGGASSESVKQYDQLISIKKLEENVYQIIPTQGLLPGEYTFYISHKFYAFGVD